MDLNQLKKLQAKLRQLNQAKIEGFLKEEILNNSDEIVEIVRNRWKRGERPDGSIIGEYRSFAYEMEKRQRNPLAGGNVDLINTGALSKGLVVNHLTGSLFNIFSTDIKAVPIAEKYGLDNYGLSKEKEIMVIDEAIKRVYDRCFRFIEA